ncbi:MAG: type I restriction-modification system endonuclease [Eubacteriales bacterium]
MKSNFIFLKEEVPELYQLGRLAEKYLYSDSNACLFKLGLFGETIVHLIMRLNYVEPPRTENSHANRILVLKRVGLLPDEIDHILTPLRKKRNKASHANYDDTDESKILLKMCHQLGWWFVNVYATTKMDQIPFVLPEKVKPIDKSAYLNKIQAQEKMILDLQEKIKQQEANFTPPITPVSTKEREEKVEKSQKVANAILLSEEETRLIIDAQLRKVGWEVDSKELRHSKGSRPQKGKNLAIAEWPTDGISRKKGYADYALFIGEKMVAMIEAKKMGEDVSSVIDVQCKEYASHVKEEHAHYVIDQWNGYSVPFVYATNGRNYNKQMETMSGIWSLDLRRSSNIPRVLQGWSSPSNMEQILEKEIKKSNLGLKNTSFDLLTDKAGLRLRPYQVEAIEKVEEAVFSGKSTALLSMATGTGKTRTILGMMYRFLKAKRFYRILFLVDRRALGDQATEVFGEEKLEDLLTLNEIFNIKTLEEKEIELETKIHVSTVQALVQRVLYNEKDKIPAVSDYDLIIIDEAHRGYALDKDMDEDELLYRNEKDFLSKYKAVIDYFDAFKVAMTATPALHTTEIFGEPVYNYSYRQAVLDGFLVDHDAPHNIKTKLSIEGISYQKGDVLAVYDPITGEVVNSAALEDELNFDIEKFNRDVITEDFNRTVFNEIAQDLNPEGEGKTLIFAVNDKHADLIVKILHEIYEEMGVHQDVVQKITGKSGDEKRRKELIRRFKNEKYPNIAVTVDLLTTGIDVVEITSLVFMRRVKSRILFEQMLGRATRLCKKIGKTHFEIYDPVGVYEALKEVSTMKPVVVNHETTYEDLMNGFAVLETEDKIKHQIDLIVAKIRRKEKRMTQGQKEKFEASTDGTSVADFLSQIQSLPPKDAKDRFQKLQQNTEFFTILAEGGVDARRAVVISDQKDEFVSHTRGYGNGVREEDYIESFQHYLSENKEKIEALKTVCTSPSSLTRKELKSLRMALDSEGFTEIQLTSAINTMKNEDIVVDLVNIIRNLAVGAELMDHNDRIENAVSKLKKAHKFTKMESDWLDRIEKNLLTETVLSKDTFDTGYFRDQGGFKRIDKIFGNKLGEYIIELNQYLYDDGGKTA